MPLTLALIASVPTDAVTQGFLPAAHRLGWKVKLYTQVPELHREAYRSLPFEVEVIEADVFRFQSLISTVLEQGSPDVVFSNSDHLQTQTALLAQYLGLPGKPWQAALRAKNKWLMRQHLQNPIHHTVLHPGEPLNLQQPYPVVLKPREGVSSQHVYLIPDPDTLQQRVQQVRESSEVPLVIEELLSGDLYTLETLGDGENLLVLGGFHTVISPPPHFIERRLVWQPELPAAVQEDVLRQLSKLGVGFGSCHTEFVWDGKRVALIEVNYRNVGDQCDLMLQDLLDFPLFEWVLRVHAGEKLPAVQFPRRNAVIHYLFPDHDGVVLQAPTDENFFVDGTTVTFQAISRTGDTVDAHSSNPSSLGVLRAVGGPLEQIEAVIQTLERSLKWHIQPHSVLQQP